jgi:hypothetical protein
MSNIHEDIVKEFPELESNMDVFAKQIIYIRDDSDGTGAYIESWDYEKPITKELSKYKR